MTEHRLSLAQLAKTDLGSHTIFSASGSALWMNCSGGLIANLLVKDSAGEAAAEGTVAHGIGEEWLKRGERPAEMLGTVQEVREGEQVFEIEVDETMFDYVQQYVDWCACLPGDHFVEQKVYYSEFTPLDKQGGTADHVACEAGKMVITDLKYGKGVQVYAKRNTQGMLYALGFFLKYDWVYDFQTITIRICQPRLDHFDEWTVSRDELMQFAGEVKVKSHMAWRLDAPRTASPKACQWCNAKPTCGAHAVMIDRLAVDATEGAFDNLDADVTATEAQDLVERLEDEFSVYEPSMCDPQAMSLEQMVKVYPYRNMIEGWFKRLEERIEAALKSGKPVPGYKLVLGRSFREFKYEHEAAEHLEFLGLDIETYAPRRMISPAQAGDALVKIGYKRRQLEKLLDSVVSKPPGAPTMAPEHDPRPALIDATKDAFEVLDDEL